MMKHKMIRIICALLILFSVGCRKKEEIPEPADTPVPAETAAPSPEAAEKTPVPSPSPEAEADKITYSEFLQENDAKASGDHFLVYEYPMRLEGREIYGWLYLPDDDRGSWPFVLVSHGFQGNYYHSSDKASRLADTGIAVYVFDFCGGSTYSRSSGDFYDMSVLTEKNDLSALLDAFAEYEFLEQENTFLLGESQGGAVSALLAAERPDDVAGLILFYPAFNIPAIGRELYGDMDHIPADPSAFGVPVGWRYFGDTIDMDIYSLISGYDKNVIILHGTDDTIVPYSFSEKALSVYRNALLEPFEHAVHGFSGEELDRACRLASEFIFQNTDS